MISKLVQWAKDKTQGKPTKSKYGKGRSSFWPAARKEHLKREPKCAWCGGKNNLEVHHVKPFHLHPELELDQDNLITLCETAETKCHLHHGHNGNWHEENPEIRKQCDEHKAS